MTTVLRSALQRPGVRYLLVGGSVFGLELLIITTLQTLGATPTQAVAVSFTIGTAVSFLLQKLFTFSDKRLHHKVVTVQVAATALLIAWNFGFSVLLAKLLEHSLPATVTRTIALLVTTTWNFYLYKTHIFKQ